MLHPLRELPLDLLRRRTSAKWRTYDPDVLPLWVAEMDVTPPIEVVEALVDAVTAGDTGYPAGTGYADSYADFAEQRWGWRADPGATRLAADLMTGLVEAVRLVTDPGDTVVVSPPVYPPFYAFVEHSGRQVAEAPLGADGRLDLEVLDVVLADAVARAPRVAYWLCSPQNPTAVVHTAEELMALARLARTHGVRVVVDEIHAPLVADGFVPYLSVPGAEDALVVVSASKAWNLAGAKASLVVAGPEASETISAMPEIVGHGPSHLGAIGHTAAWRHGVPWLDGLQADLADNRVLLRRLLDEHLPDVAWNGEAGTFLAWLDCRRLGLGDDPAAAFLERGRVALTSGVPFGRGAGFARLNYATTPEVLTEAVARMGATVR